MTKIREEPPEAEALAAVRRLGFEAGRSRELPDENSRPSPWRQFDWLALRQVEIGDVVVGMLRPPRSIPTGDVIEGSLVLRTPRDLFKTDPMRSGPREGIPP